MLGVILLVFLSPLISWLLYWCFSYYYFERYLKNIPGPTPLPLLGSALELASPVTFLWKLIEYNKKFKGNFKVYIGAQAVLFVCEPKDLEFVFNSTALIAKSKDYRFLHHWLGTGLLTSSGDKWKKHRKIITPAFHFQILEDFIDVFNSASRILIDKFDASSKKGSFDIYPFITRCTLDIICETAMGTSVKAQDDLDSEYVKCVNYLLKVLRERALSPLLSNDLLYSFTKRYRQEREALKVVHGYTKSVINRRKAEFLSNRESDGEKVDSFGGKRRRALLDLLLEYSSKDPSFTETDIREEVDTFMFEGHDTTATSITFALYAIATNSEVQRKAYAELKEIFSDNPARRATYKDLQEMKYLEMVIKETLRLYTTVPLTGRTVERDVYMNGLLLPKGLMVTIGSHTTMHNHELYEDPQKFDPDRFSIENSQGRNPYSYIPFSAGSRNCIGQRFAMFEMKTTISEVLRYFELLPAVPEHKMVLKSEAVLKSTNGVFIRLKRRT